MFCKKGSRKIVVNDILYIYKVTRSGDTIILFPDEKTQKIKFYDLTGMTYDAYETGTHKKTSDGMITPSIIKNWIEKNVK